MFATAVRFAPLVGTTLVFALGFGGRTWLHHRRYGHSGVILFRQTGTWARLRDVSLLLLPVALLLLTLMQALQPGWPGWGHFPFLDSALFVGVGIALLLLSIGLLLAAQLQMGRSWRVGIDEAAAPGLVTGGLFRHSRSPIFASLLAALLALFLLMPCALSLLLLCVTYGGIRRQIADEERYLQRTYPDQYLPYAARVGRFVPWLGRLSPPTSHL